MTRSAPSSSHWKARKPLHGVAGFHTKPDAPGDEVVAPAARRPALRPRPFEDEARVESGHVERQGDKAAVGLRFGLVRADGSELCRRERAAVAAGRDVQLRAHLGMQVVTSHGALGGRGGIAGRRARAVGNVDALHGGHELPRRGIAAERRQRSRVPPEVAQRTGRRGDDRPACCAERERGLPFARRGSLATHLVSRAGGERRAVRLSSARALRAMRRSRRSSGRARPRLWCRRLAGTRRSPAGTTRGSRGSPVDRGIRAGLVDVDRPGAERTSTRRASVSRPARGSSRHRSRRVRRAASGSRTAGRALGDEASPTSPISPRPAWAAAATGPVVTRAASAADETRNGACSARSEVTPAPSKACAGTIASSSLPVRAARTAARSIRSAGVVGSNRVGQ